MRKKFPESEKFSTCAHARPRKRAARGENGLARLLHQSMRRQALPAKLNQGD
jgi:hypothetical protein